MTDVTDATDATDATDVTGDSPWVYRRELLCRGRAQLTKDELQLVQLVPT